MSNIKYTHNGKTVRQICHELGMSEKRYKMIIWLMKNKFMEFEEALSFKRQPAQKDQLTRKRNCGRRFRGWSDEELKMSVEEAMHFGNMKKSKWTVGNKTLREYCKENGLCYNTIRDRIVKNNMTVREAINEPIVHPKKVYYKGKRICKLFDRQTCHTIYSRIRDGWSVSDAVEVPIDSFYNRKPKDDFIKNKFWGSLGYKIGGMYFINNKQKEYDT